MILDEAVTQTENEEQQEVPVTTAPHLSQHPALVTMKPPSTVNSAPIRCKLCMHPPTVTPTSNPHTIYTSLHVSPKLMEKEADIQRKKFSLSSPQPFPPTHARAHTNTDRYVPTNKGAVQVCCRQKTRTKNAGKSYQKCW